jgi:CSLREA domain-containing protein
LTPLDASPAEAADPPTFVVNKKTNEADAQTGDGLCGTWTGGCTLRAAIQEANRTSGAKIVLDPTVFTAAWTLGLTEASADFMAEGQAISPIDRNAFFHIKAPMTIDLMGRMGLYPKDANSAHNTAAFWVDAANVKLEGLAWVYGTGTSVVFSPNSDGSSLKNGHTIAGLNGRTQNMVRVMPGADNITIDNFQMGRIDGSQPGMIRVAAGSTSDPPVKNLTINRVTFDNTPGSTGDCNLSDASGCAGSAIVLAGGVQVEGLTITNSTFSYMPKDLNAIDLSAAGVCKNIKINGNTFTRIMSGTAPALATIHLPLKTRLDGQNYIQDNTFDNVGSTAQHFAIRWLGPYTSVATPAPASNLYIERNTFNGYQAQTILLDQAGAVTVRRNTFGTQSGSRPATQDEETVGGATGTNASAMIMNYSATTNEKILTWYPTYAEVKDCELTVKVEPPASAPAGSAIPNPPVDLDFYYTSGTTAETYFTTIEKVAEGGLLTLSKLPESDGYIRIQTQGAASATGQPESSQFSRTVPLTGAKACYTTPQLKIELRAWQDVDGSAADYASIIEKATEIPDQGYAPFDGAIWFTYTVTNNAFVPANDVVVSDSFNTEACVIPRIVRGQPQGCVERFR